MSGVTKCTWWQCENDATEPQVNPDGSMWANLCKEHSTVMDDAINTGDSFKIFAAWVKSQGDKDDLSGPVFDWVRERGTEYGIV